MVEACVIAERGRVVAGAAGSGRFGGDTTCTSLVEAVCTTVIVQVYAAPDRQTLAQRRQYRWLRRRRYTEDGPVQAQALELGLLFLGGSPGAARRAAGLSPTLAMSMDFII